MKVKVIHCFCSLLLFTACSIQSEPFSERDRIAVRFSLSGIQAEVSTRADGDGTSPLAEGTTLRILAFKRVGTNADLSKDEYMGEGTYKVTGNTLDSDSPLLLQEDTYDFYALTPALTVKQAGTGMRTYIVSVGYGDDYATSLSKAKHVSMKSPTITLETLTRHCAKLGFRAFPILGNISSLRIHSIEMTNMVKSPVEKPLNEPIPMADGDAGTTLTLTEFVSTTKMEFSTSTIALPRKAGAFKLTMKALVNGIEETYSASLPTGLAFQPGYCYDFTIKLKGDAAALELSALPWSEHSQGTGDMGAFYNITLTVVKGWENVELDGGSLGESTTN